MAQVVRLIWRLDFGVSFAYLDKRGAALKALTETVSGFWQQIAEGNVAHSFVGEFRDDQGGRTISIEPQSLSGSVEWTAGTDFSRVLQTDVFRSVDKIARELQRICEVREITRAGIRFICVDKTVPDPNSKVDKYKKLLDQAFLRSSQASLGPVNDIGITLEGTTLDKVNYRVTFGPLATKNIDMSLSKKLTSAGEEYFSQFDLFSDMDFYENRIFFQENSLYRWAQTKLPKALDFLSEFNKVPSIQEA